MLAIHYKLKFQMIIMSIVNIRILIASMGLCPRYFEQLSHLKLQLKSLSFHCCVVMKGTNLAMGLGFPANACPPALMANICSDPIVPQPQLLDMVCLFSNNNAINMPLHSQPANPSYIQCHYSTSKCYYDICFIHSDDRAYL